MLDTLRRITQEINNAINLDEGLAAVVRRVKEHLAADVCSIYLVDAAGSHFGLMTTDGQDPRAAGAVRFGQGEGLVGWIVERQCPVSLINAQQHARFRHFPEFGEQAYHAFLGVPFIHYRNVLGVLAVRQMNDRVFVGEEEAFLITIAAELASLIHASITDAQDIPRYVGPQTTRLLRGIKGAPGVGIGLGVMIEVPSAIYQMQALAKRVDFFSIGTNDLTQYLLAVDRNNARVSRHFDSLHPAVIRAIDHAVRQVRDARKPISVCGEMAGDPASAVLLLGIEVLSMASPSIPRVKRALRTFTRQRAQELAAEAIDAENPAEVHRLLNAAFEQVGLGVSRKAGPSRSELDGIFFHQDGQTGQSATRGRDISKRREKLT